MINSYVRMRNRTGRNRISIKYRTNDQITKGDVMDNNSTTNLKHIIDLTGDPMPVIWKQKGYNVEIEKHVGEGLLELDPTRLQLYLSQNQQGMVSQPKRFPCLSEGYAATREWVGKLMTGRDLLKELEENKIPVLNACVLDYLLLHPELIPNEWKVDFPGEWKPEYWGVQQKQIVFWGTIYRGDKSFHNPGGKLYVRCLMYRHNHIDQNLNRWETFELALNDKWGVGRCTSSFGIDQPAAILAPLQP